jgi:hypothetical protein
VKPNLGPSGEVTAVGFNGRFFASIKHAGREARVPPRTARNSARTLSVVIGGMKHAF